MLYRLTAQLNSVQLACLWYFREDSFQGKRFEWQPPFSPLSSQCRKKSPKVITWNKQKAQLSQKIFFWKRKTQLVTPRQQYLHTWSRLQWQTQPSLQERSCLPDGKGILWDDTSCKSSGSSCLTHQRAFCFLEMSQKSHTRRQNPSTAMTHTIRKPIALYVLDKFVLYMRCIQISHSDTTSLWMMQKYLFWKSLTRFDAINPRYMAPAETYNPIYTPSLCSW